ncbi:hypothetical protein ACLBXM_06460 [Xanthobacteraceae bacterium A53D]
MMVRLPPIDFEANRLREQLTEGKQRREEVKERVLEVLAAGAASPPMQKLAAELFGAKRGRQSTGLFKWMEIGEAAERMADDGLSRTEILQRLAEQFGRSEKHIDACMTQWRKGRAEG